MPAFRSVFSSQPLHNPRAQHFVAASRLPSPAPNHPSEPTERQGEQEEQHQRSCAPLQKVGVLGQESGDGHCNSSMCRNVLVRQSLHPPVLGCWARTVPTRREKQPWADLPSHRGGPAAAWPSANPSPAAAEPSARFLRQLSSSLLSGECCSSHSSAEHMVHSHQHTGRLSSLLREEWERSLHPPAPSSRLQGDEPLSLNALLAGGPCCPENSNCFCQHSLCPH